MHEPKWVDYADFVSELSMRNGEALSRDDAFMLGSMGLAGETGEVIDLLKKHVWHDHPLDRDKLLRELGDVLWYLQLIADSTGFSMEDVRDANIAKLKARYPTGRFDVEQSKH